MEKKPLEIVEEGIKQTIYYQDCREGMRAHLEDNSVDLIVTSPPYWDLKDYGIEEQIGFGQDLEEYRENMRGVFQECFRVLKEAQRMVVNIRDKILPSGKVADPKHRGNFEMVPLHAYIIEDAMAAGFKYIGIIFWEKIGGGRAQHTKAMNYLGSYPFPPNAHITSKMEYILIFRKKEDVKSKPVPREKEIREASRFTEKKWLEYTSQVWSFPGSHVEGHPAAFPIELPRRCITLWSFVGDLILDPFIGSGSTLRASKDLRRNGIGFEINPQYEDLQRKILSNQRLDTFFTKSAESSEEDKADET